MNRFSFITGTVPVEKGEGVEWDDRRAAYRTYAGGYWSQVVDGRIKDIEDAYGGQGGYSFTWQDVRPTVTAISPTSGPITPATTITVNGTGFTETGMTVTIGGVATTNFTFVSATRVTVKNATTLEAGKHAVDVTTGGGTASLKDAWTAVAAPTLGTLTPANGPAAGGNNVAITGTGFRAPGATAPPFDGTAGTSWLVVSDTSCTIKPPAHAAGAVDVVFANAGGSVTKAGGYTYDAARVVAAPPVINSISPTSGPDPTTITITGSGFKTGITQAPRVFAGETELSSGKLINSDSEIQIQVAGVTGQVAIKVTTTAGESNVNKKFTVTA